MLFAFSMLIPFPSVPKLPLPFQPCFLTNSLLGTVFPMPDPYQSVLPTHKSFKLLFSLFLLPLPSYRFFSYLQGAITAFLVLIIYPRLIYPRQKAAPLCQASPPRAPVEPHAFGGVAWPSAGDRHGFSGCLDVIQRC